MNSLLLPGDGGGEHVSSDASVLLWYHHTQQALLTSFLPQFPAHLPRFLPPTVTQKKTNQIPARIKIHDFSSVDILFVVGNHFLLEEPPDALSENVVVFVEDSASSDIHHGLGPRGL